MNRARLIAIASLVGAACGCEREAVAPEAEHRLSSAPPSATALSSVEPAETSTHTVPATDEPFAVLQLFTSEGCSSCPAADTVLGAVTEEVARKHLNVMTLELHVDYWDDLGWADPFGSSAYSARQRVYATKLHLAELYTPQLIVNGRWQLVGSRQTELHAVLARALDVPAALRVDASARLGPTSREVRVDYATRATDRAHREVAVALVQDRAKTHVARGENAFRTLEHRHVVRALKLRKLEGDRGTVVAEWPAGAVPPDALAVVLISDAESGAILGARWVRVCTTSDCHESP
jgi:hypothetical protein